MPQQNNVAHPKHPEEDTRRPIFLSHVSALDNLVANTMKGGNLGNSIWYIKLGNLETAVNDFIHLKPKDIRTPITGHYTSKVSYYVTIQVKRQVCQNES